MIVQSEGYELTFVQKRPCKDKSKHLFTLIYKFKSPKTGLVYVVLADYHEEHVFAIKFYAKRHRKSDFKYSKIINRGDLSNILVTNASLIPQLLENYPGCSFGFIGSRTFDKKSGKVEQYQFTQRYRIYKEFVRQLIGDETFVHYQYNEFSAYLLINRKHKDIVKAERAIAKMFTETYNNLPDI